MYGLGKIIAHWCCYPADGESTICGAANGSLPDHYRVISPMCARQRHFPRLSRPHRLCSLPSLPSLARRRRRNSTVLGLLFGISFSSSTSTRDERRKTTTFGRQRLTDNGSYAADVAATVGPRAHLPCGGLRLSEIRPDI